MIAQDAYNLASQWNLNPYQTLLDILQNAIQQAASSGFFETAYGVSRWDGETIGRVTEELTNQGYKVTVVNNNDWQEMNINFNIEEV